MKYRQAGSYRHYVEPLMKIDPAWGRLDYFSGSANNKSVVALFSSFLENPKRTVTTVVFNGTIVAKYNATVFTPIFSLNYDGTKLALVASDKGRLEIAIFENGAAVPCTRYPVAWSCISGLAWLDNERVIYEGRNATSTNETQVNGVPTDWKFEEIVDGLILHTEDSKHHITQAGIILPLEEDTLNDAVVEVNSKTYTHRVRYGNYLGPEVNQVVGEIDVSNDDRFIAYAATTPSIFTTALPKVGSLALGMGCFTIFFLPLIFMLGILEWIFRLNIISIVKNHQIWEKTYSRVDELFFLPNNDLLVVASKFGKARVVVEQFEGPIFNEIKNVSVSNNSISYLGYCKKEIFRVELVTSGR